MTEPRRSNRERNAGLDGSVASRARLRAASAPHAGAWLQALPSKALDQRHSHCEFAAALQLWLGSAPLTSDTWCPKCDQVLDAGGFHALSCMAGGDAINCHNSLRDHVFFASRAAGLNPRREESGLLPDDPRRRPGDLFFPLWPGGAPVAMDFAVTSPLNLAALAGAAERSLDAASSYEQRKRDDRETARKCEALGISLVPMVAESFGGWGGEAQKAFKIIAQASASRTGHSASIVTAQLYEGLSIKIMRAGARALLARIADVVAMPENDARQRARASLSRTAATMEEA